MPKGLRILGNCMHDAAYTSNTSLTIGCSFALYENRTGGESYSWQHAYKYTPEGDTGPILLLREIVFSKPTIDMQNGLLHEFSNCSLRQSIELLNQIVSSHRLAIAAIVSKHSCTGLRRCTVVVIIDPAKVSYVDSWVVKFIVSKGVTQQVQIGN